jgi:hypothetical protein
MGVRYKCSYCEKPFIGDYGQEGKLFVWCSEQCEKDWRDRFAKNAMALPCAAKAYNFPGRYYCLRGHVRVLHVRVVLQTERRLCKGL